MIRPLHEASTTAVAEALLAAGAAPSSLDPREPDIAWYHRQHRRPEVANMVAAAARYQKQQLAAETLSSSPAAAATAPSRVYPCLTGSEISAAIQSWSTDGAAVRRLLHRVADRGLEHAMGERGRICGV